MPETPNCSLLVTVALSLSCAITAQEPLPRIVLNGRVVDVLGNGIPVADVRVLDLDDGTVLGRITSDGDGQFRLKVPERTAYQVRGAAEGFATCYLEMKPVGGDVTLVRGCKLRGRILGPDGKPQAGVPVGSTTGQRILGRPEPVRSTTDEDGRFELAGVPLGYNEVFARRLDGPLLYCSLRATGDGSIMMRLPATGLRVPAGLLPSPAIAVADPAPDAEPPMVRPDLPFAVRVLGPDSQPIPELLVMAQVEGRHSFQLSRCGQDGVATFAEPLPLGARVVVSTRDDLWAVHRLERLTTRMPPRPSGTCVATVGDRVPGVIVKPANKVTACVRTFGDKPAAGVLVLLEQARTGPEGFESIRCVRTDDEGRCEFAGLHPDLGELRVTIAGEHGFFTGEAFAFVPEQRVEPLTVKLTPATVVTGMVIDTDGSPRAATAVQLRRTNPYFQASTMSDIDGRYRLLGPGGETVVLSTDRSGPEVELPIGAPLQFDLSMTIR